MSSITYRKAGLVSRDVLWALRISAGWFAAIVVVVFLGIGVGIELAGGLDGSTPNSVWETSAYATRYWPMAMGIMLTPFYLPVCVASGVTRRSFGIGAALVVAGLAAVMAVLEGVGYIVEHGLYALADSTPQFESPHLFDSGLHIWVSMPEVWITVCGNVAAGWLIGSVYYRWGWLWPTLALPLLVVPTLAVEAAMSVGWPGDVMIGVLGVDRAPLGVAIPASLVIIALTLWGTHRLVRTTAVRPRRA
ncbi:hypothetical protein CLV30_10732 [Haloactinopolyspora alba]|uniref:Uncharacterized protein n=1 Tax=Haloactinopolyspora alba TaxID=648780 RepID=A0A2P8E263_9ACTN|nr:hypothetical protein [Haloactinopolyspora alba]PSL03553.1 hypothetical protein CLV30_10732 [Haloactinopolyspora alba]